MRRRPLVTLVLYVVAWLLALPGLGVLLLVAASWWRRGVGNLNAGDLAVAMPLLSVAFTLIVLALLFWALGAILRELRAIRLDRPASPGRTPFAPVYPAPPEIREPVADTLPGPR